MHPTSEMMSKCRKWHLREPKFAKFGGMPPDPDPLEARAFGARVSSSSAKKNTPYFPSKWVGTSALSTQQIKEPPSTESTLRAWTSWPLVTSM